MTITGVAEKLMGREKVEKCLARWVAMNRSRLGGGGGGGWCCSGGKVGFTQQGGEGQRGVYQRVLLARSIRATEGRPHGEGKEKLVGSCRGGGMCRWLGGKRVKRNTWHRKTDRGRKEVLGRSRWGGKERWLAACIHLR